MVTLSIQGEKPYKTKIENNFYFYLFSESIVYFLSNLLCALIVTFLKAGFEFFIRILTND